MSRLGHRTRLLGAGYQARVSQWFQRSQVKSIQRATIAITGATSNTATITAVVTANSRLRFLGCICTNGSVASEAALARIALTNSTTVTATVDTTPGAQTTSVSFEVIEYWPGVIKSVQRGTVSTTATITEVNTAKAEVDFLGNTTTAAVADTSSGAYVVLTDSTTVTMTGGTSVGQIAGYQVVEWY